MRYWRFMIAVFPLIAQACVAGQEQPPQDTEKSEAAPIKSSFHIRYINGSNVYIDGGRDDGLTEGAHLVLKQDPTKPPDDPSNSAVAPGVVAKLTVVAVASTSAVCQVEAKGREILPGETVTLTDAEVEKVVEKDTLGNTRKYPMVISFSTGDPLDEEVRNAIPRPPLPEVNAMRGRIGFDMSTIRELGQGGGSTNEYGMVFRADFTRMFGSHWNLNGYWRGERQTGSGSIATLQDLIDRTYLIELTYVNPESAWTAGMGRLYLPWASSLDTIDGIYVARKATSNSLFGIFAGSTPDPTAWNYSPQRRIGGAFVNVHGGDFDRVRGRRVNHRPHLRHRIRRELPQLRMLAHRRLIRRNVHAVDLVVGHIGLHPLNLRPHPLQHIARVLRDALQLLGTQRARPGNLPLNHKLRHRQSPSRSILAASKPLHPNSGRCVFPKN